MDKMNRHFGAQLRGENTLMHHEAKLYSVQESDSRTSSKESFVGNLREMKDISICFLSPTILDSRKYH